MENVFGRHANIGRLTRDGVRALGLVLLVADESYASNTVTAVKMPEGVNGKKLISMMRTNHNVVLAGGQGKLSNNIFRIGHLGQVTEDDINGVMAALKKVLPQVGFKRNH